MIYNDINFDSNGIIFSVRSCGIIYNDNKILLHKKNGDDFYALIGGRVKIKESTIDAVKREFYEELNINVEIINQLYCIENFFKHDSKNHHELMFVYLLKTNDTIPNENFIVDENLFCWIDIDNINKIKIKPDIIKSYIFENLEEISSLKSKHIIDIE